LSPTLRKRIIFGNVKDVYNELERCYDEALQVKNREYTLGEALYSQYLLFSNAGTFYNEKYQRIIGMYIFTKMTGTPPYPSINVIPWEIYDSYLIIGQEI